MLFHSEQGEESNSCFYMHYESDVNVFVSPDLLMKRSDVCSGTKDIESFSFPQESVNEN